MINELFARSSVVFEVVVEAVITVGVSPRAAPGAAIASSKAAHAIAPRRSVALVGTSEWQVQVGRPIRSAE